MYHLCFMHRSSTILCPFACSLGTWKLWLHIVVSCGRHPTTPLLGPGRQISYCYTWVDGILVESLSRVMRGYFNNQDRLSQDFSRPRDAMQLWVKDGWSAPWRNQWMTRDAGDVPWHLAESFTQAQRDGRIFSRPKAYLHSHKSLWALAWLDNAMTLDRRC